MAKKTLGDIFFFQLLFIVADNVPHYPLKVY